MNNGNANGLYQKVALRRAEVLERIIKRPSTAVQIAKEMGVSTMTAYKDVRFLKAERKIHIEKYLGMGDVRSIPVYAAGDSSDAEVPDRKRMAMEKAQQTWTKRVEKEVVRKQHVFRHWLDVAFFGEYGVANGG